MPVPGRIKVTLARSLIGRLKTHKDCVRGLGLKKTGTSKFLYDTPSVRGMIDKVSYLLDIEEITGAETRSRPRLAARPLSHPGYIWERENWPDFTYDEERLQALIEEIEHERADLRQKFEDAGISDDRKNDLALSLSELCLTPESPPGIDAIMGDATENYDQPLTKERLCGWQSILFPDRIADGKHIVTGEYRDDRDGPMVVESGYIGKEKTHFEAPPATSVESEMSRFLAWTDSNDVNPHLKAGIAHLWFLTIHPFDNGNGRIARAIAELMLSASENNAMRLYSVSAAIHRHRNDYDSQIEWAQKGELDITRWLHWYLKLELGAITYSQARLPDEIRRYAFWKTFPEESLNKRQLKIMHKFLDDFQGKLTVKKWAKIGKCSEETARNDIDNLVQRGALKLDDKTGGKSSYIVNDATLDGET